MKPAPTIFTLSCVLFVSLTCQLPPRGCLAGEKEAKLLEVEIEDITLRVPADWKQIEPRSRLHKAQFAIPKAEGDAEDAELSVFFFGGGGGGVDANIKRWVDQFQPKDRTAKMTQGKSAQGEYVLADLGGTYNKPIPPPILNKTEPMPNARMLGVILHVEGKGNYFLKLTGPKKTVDGVAEAFRGSFGGDEKSEKPYERADAE